MNESKEVYDHALAEQSQVSESSNKRRLNKAARLSLFLLVLVLFGSAYLTSKFHSAKKDVTQNQNNADNSYTLQENLKAIDRMQQAQTSRHVNTHKNHPIPQHQEPMDAELIARMNAPTTFVNVTHAAIKKAQKNPELATPLFSGQDSNSAFLNSRSEVELVNAVALPHPEYTVGAGEFIPAVMETAENSELPGIVRAVVSRDVYSITGDRKLIDNGSMLFGHYASGNIAPAQTRFLVIWTRVQLPNGIVVTLNSPAADNLGRGGLGADAINHHFSERFSLGLLYSILGTTSATMGVHPADEYNSKAQYRMNMANSLEQSARDSLQQNRNIQNTLYKFQGAEIQVTVTRDLDFYHVLRDKR